MVAEPVGHCDLQIGGHSGRCTRCRSNQYVVGRGSDDLHVGHQVLSNKVTVSFAIQITDQLPVTVGWVVCDFNPGTARVPIADCNYKCLPSGQPAFADNREETTPRR